MNPVSVVPSLSSESVTESFHLFTFSAADMSKIHESLFNTIDCDRALDLLKEKYVDHDRFFNSYAPEYLEGEKGHWNRALRPCGWPSDNNGLEAHNRQIKVVSVIFLEII